MSTPGSGFLFRHNTVHPLSAMLQMSNDDLFLPPHQVLVDNLLSNKDSAGDTEGSSLAKSLLPMVESSCSPLVPWVCSTRYKTELCTSYAESGSCKYADRCQFAHGLHELHVPFRHPKYKTELCRSYHTTGYCYYGNRCLFVHDPTEQRQSVRRRRKIPCRTFSAFGVCPFGTHCNFLHVEEGDFSESLESSDVDEKRPFRPNLQPRSKEWRPRGAICRTFSSYGFCLYGTRCRFQHTLPRKLKLSNKNRRGCVSPQTSNGSTGLPSPLLSSITPTSSPPAEATAHNAFTFSSQHLSDLLLPLALHLQQLESSKAQEIWDNRAI